MKTKSTNSLAQILSLSLGLIAASTVQCQSIQPPVAISSSIITFDYDHMENHARCVQQVEAAAKVSGSDRLMFVPTLYFHDTNPKADSNKHTKMDYLCYRAKPCNQTLKQDTQLFQSAMQKCFKRAVDLGFNIAITPHLDDARQGGLWRNSLVFSPEQPMKNNQTNYYDGVLKPLINALNAVRKPDTKIWFGMQVRSSKLYLIESLIIFREKCQRAFS